MKAWLAGLTIILYLSAAAVGLAQPQVSLVPTNSFYVQDYAGVLDSETKGRINALGRKLKTASKAHIIVVTINSLEGGVPADFARDIIKQWGVGDKKLNNGVLLLLVTGENKYRIEVGYGLEGALPDAKAGEILDEKLLPYVQKGDYNQGVWQAYKELAGIAAKEYEVDLNEAGNKTAAAANKTEQAWPWWLKIVAAIALIGFLIFDNVALGGFFTGLILGLLASGGRKGGGSGGGDGFGGGSGGGGGADR